MNSASVSFMSIFNRLGCTVSYPIFEALRRTVIQKRKERGSFSDVESNCFVSCAIDNVNVRTMHTMGVHGGTNTGFDGLAMQAVNSDKSFDYSAFCASQPPENSNLSATPVGTRDEFISRVIADPNTNPNIVGFRYLAVGLACAHK